jgi:hypothetical protein
MVLLGVRRMVLFRADMSESEDVMITPSKQGIVCACAEHQMLLAVAWGVNMRV